MTETQVLTLVLTLLGIFAASWFNNARMSDLSKRIDNMRDLLRAELKAEIVTVRTDMQTGFNDLRHRLDKIDDKIARMLADHESPHQQT